jgi:chorismate synthase
MGGNTFGRHFRVTTFGESHGPGIGLVIDGCPAGLELDMAQICYEMGRRRPGQSALVTQRDEADEIEWLAGVYDMVTTGAPIALFIKNRDARSKDYDELEKVYRPSHADYTYAMKYGLRDHRGGGRSSARETAARVAAGAIARQLLASSGIRIQAFVQSVHHISLDATPQWWDPQSIEHSAVRCPNEQASQKMERAIAEAKENGDSLGGIIAGYADGLPAGLGAPVFDRLEADLARAMLSINACKGFDIGSGFSGTRLKGSEHNDPFEVSDGRIITKGNNSGGVQGGISNGMPIHFRCAFKPTSTIGKAQATISTSGDQVTLQAKGRHDPCVLPRAVPIVEAMTALVLADHWLRSKTDKMDAIR